MPSNTSLQPQRQLQEEEEGGSGSPAGGAGKGGKQGGKGKKVLNIGSQRGQGKGQQDQGPAPPPPPSVWGQQDAAAMKRRAEVERQRLAQQAAGRGQWAQSGGNRLARSIGAINDAWGE